MGKSKDLSQNPSTAYKNIREENKLKFLQMVPLLFLSTINVALAENIFLECNGERTSFLSKDGQLANETSRETNHVEINIHENWRVGDVKVNNSTKFINQCIMRPNVIKCESFIQDTAFELTLNRNNGFMMYRSSSDKDGYIYISTFSGSCEKKENKRIF